MAPLKKVYFSFVLALFRCSLSLSFIVCIVSIINTNDSLHVLKCTALFCALGYIQTLRGSIHCTVLHSVGLHGITVQCDAPLCTGTALLYTKLILHCPALHVHCSVLNSSFLAFTPTALPQCEP